MDKETIEASSCTFQSEDNSHCEKVRRIIEQKPAFIVRWGNTILLVFLLILFVLLGYFLGV